MAPTSSDGRPSNDPSGPRPARPPHRRPLGRPARDPAYDQPYERPYDRAAGSAYGSGAYEPAYESGAYDPGYRPEPYEPAPYEPPPYEPPPFQPPESEPPRYEPSAPPGAPPPRTAPSAPRAGRPERAAARRDVPPEPPSARPPARTRWAPVVIGTPVAEFEPLPPAGKVYRPDTVFDGWSTDHLTVRLASVRGYQHRHDARPREDDVAVTVHRATGTLVFAVADGVSSAAQPDIGAAFACRGAVDSVVDQLDRCVSRREREERDRAHRLRLPELQPFGAGGPGVPQESAAEAVDWGLVVRSAAWQLFARAAHGKEPTEHDRQQAERLYATTLVTGTVSPKEHGVLEVRVVRAGDSAAWRLRGGVFEPLLAGKSAAEGGVLCTAVSPLPRASERRMEPLTAVLPPDAALVVGTDGFGDPLGDGQGDVGRRFADWLRVPPPAHALAHLLDFSRETFDDDRTLLAVWPRHQLADGPR